jgi:hypothetical protein
MRYNTYWVYECLLIQIKSCKAYEHLRKHKILALSNIDTLNRYINKMDSGYGYGYGHKHIKKKKNHLECPWNKGGVSLFKTLLEIQLRIILLRRYID